MIWTQLEIKVFMDQLRIIMDENRDLLISLDGVVGDGDLGLTMSAGFSAAYEAVAELNQPDIGRLLYQAGKMLGRTVPSSMGTLMASGLMNAGKAVTGRSELNVDGIYILMQGWQYGVEKLGKAKLGEKTFLDGFVPGVQALYNAEDFIQTFQQAAQEAKKGADGTVGMLAMHGRAAIRGEQSRDMMDPGAMVASLIFQALYKTAEDIYIKRKMA